MKKTVHLEPELHTALRLRAFHRGISLQELTNELLSQSLKHWYAELRFFKEAKEEDESRQEEGW